MDLRDEGGVPTDPAMPIHKIVTGGFLPLLPATWGEVDGPASGGA